MLAPTVGLSGQTGSYLNSYSYLPFGDIRSATGALSNPFQFNGQMGVMSQVNGLDYMRARFYAPWSGRFLNRDPIGLSGGTNVYTYAGNNPVAFRDPSGTDLFNFTVAVGFRVLTGLVKLAGQTQTTSDNLGWQPPAAERPRLKESQAPRHRMPPGRPYQRPSPSLWQRPEPRLRLKVPVRQWWRSPAKRQWKEGRPGGGGRVCCCRIDCSGSRLRGRLRLLATVLRRVWTISIRTS